MNKATQPDINVFKYFVPSLPVSNGTAFRLVLGMCAILTIPIWGLAVLILGIVWLAWALGKAMAEHGEGALLNLAKEKVDGRQNKGEAAASARTEDYSADRQGSNGGHGRSHYQRGSHRHDARGSDHRVRNDERSAPEKRYQGPESTERVQTDHGIT